MSSEQIRDVPRSMVNVLNIDTIWSGTVENEIGKILHTENSNSVEAGIIRFPAMSDTGVPAQVA